MIYWREPKPDEYKTWQCYITTSHSQDKLFVGVVAADPWDPINKRWKWSAELSTAPHRADRQHYIWETKAEAMAFVEVFAKRIIAEVKINE